MTSGRSKAQPLLRGLTERMTTTTRLKKGLQEEGPFVRARGTKAKGYRDQLLRLPEIDPSEAFEVAVARETHMGRIAGGTERNSGELLRC